MQDEPINSWNYLVAESIHVKSILINRLRSEIDYIRSRLLRLLIISIVDGNRLIMISDKFVLLISNWKFHLFLLVFMFPKKRLSKIRKTWLKLMKLLQKGFISWNPWCVTGLALWVSSLIFFSQEVKSQKIHTSLLGMGTRGSHPLQPLIIKRWPPGL